MDNISDSEAVTKVLAAFDSDDAPFADIKFRCEDGVVSGHLAIVAAWSATVRELALATAARPLEINVCPNTTEHMRLCRQYMYTGRASVSSNTAFALTSLSAKLDIPALKHAVEAAASARFLDASTACAFLLIGRRDGFLTMEGAARDFIRKNTAACIMSSSFFDLDPPSLVSLLRDDALTVREEDLFRQCLAWADVKANEQVKASGLNTAKGDPHVSVKVARESLIRELLPHIRFPLMGAHVFARTVVPTGVLPGEDANAILMHYMAPDIAASLLRFNTSPRRGTGSVFCWSADAAEEAGVKGLSKDRRIVEFKCKAQQGEGKGAGAAEGAAPSMVVSDQAFAAGVSSVYITTWGLSKCTVGMVVSDSDVDDGDCAMMAGEVARPESDRFEGLSVTDAEGGVCAHVHKARFEAARPPLPSATAPTGGACLQDGSCLVLNLDWDVHELEVCIWHKGSPSALKVATLKGIPAKPVRVALGAVPKPSAGDVDGVAVIASKLPPYLEPVKAGVKVEAAAAPVSAPAPAPADAAEATQPAEPVTA